MLYIIHLLFTDGFPSGQRGQTVNLLAPPSKVRILLHPANLALTSLRCRGYFFVKKETAKGHKAAPLCTPLGLFLGVLGCGGGEGVGLCLYASVLGVGRCADLVPVCFGIGGGALCRVSSQHTKKKTATSKSETAVLSSHIIHRKSKHRKKTIY